MKLTVLAMILAILLVSPAFAIYVPSDGSVVHIDVDTPGIYYVYVSGTFQWGGGDISHSLLADAEWLTNIFNDKDHWEESCIWQGFSTADDLCDLKINNEFIDWFGLGAGGNYEKHSFSPYHKYFTMIDIDKSIDMLIYDTVHGYEDNQGGLEISIVPVPEPSSVFALGAGLLGFIRFKGRRYYNEMS